MPLINLPEFAADLLAEFDARKAERIDTPVIQPAEPFLDIAGEDLRRRIFMTESETGASLCLRPEFTIPVCLRHIETRPARPSVTPISARSSASAATAPTSSIRPVSRISVTSTYRAPTPVPSVTPPAFSPACCRAGACR